MTQPPSCLSELQFAALLQYSPNGRSEASRASKEAAVRIKRGSPAHIRRIGERVAEAHAKGEFPGIFGPKVELVPAPRSKPTKEGALWPAKLICEELVRRGLAAGVSILIARTEPIEKSALHRNAKSRSGPEDHIRTMTMTGETTLFGARQLLIVDDVVTRGATMLAAASVLRQAFREASIAGFAAVRTMSGVEIDHMLAPVVGSIHQLGGWLHRDP